MGGEALGNREGLLVSMCQLLVLMVDASTPGGTSGMRDGVRVQPPSAKCNDSK